MTGNQFTIMTISGHVCANWKPQKVERNPYGDGEHQYTNITENNNKGSVADCHRRTTKINTLIAIYIHVYYISTSGFRNIANN